MPNGRTWRREALGIGWVVAAGVVVLLPAFLHGHSLGELDLLSRYGLTQTHKIQPIRNQLATDQTFALMPWESLAWTQVHHGQLPLWNPYSALGTPLAFGWQTGVLSLPTLAGYLFPLNLMYGVQMLATLVLAGVGSYLFCRVLHLSVLASTFAATSFELSGPILKWLGWPHATVVAWSGWLFAAAVLIVRSESRRARVWAVALFAVSFAFAVYAGQLEVLVILTVCLALFLLVWLVLRCGIANAHGTIRPLGDLFIATAIGLCLAAPLILPGAQVYDSSIRSATTGGSLNQATPTTLLIDFLVPRVHPFALWLGPLVFVLAVVGVWRYRKRAEVVALGVVGVFMFCIVTVQPAVALARDMPLIGSVLWSSRGALLLAFVLSVLAGCGLDTLLRNSREIRLLRQTTLLLVLSGVVIMTGWIAWSDKESLHVDFWFSIATVTIGLAVVFAFYFLRGHVGSQSERSSWRSLTVGCGVALLLGQTTFLLIAGSSWEGSGSTFYAPTSATTALKAHVGNDLVGLGSPPAHGLAIQPDANVAYAISEFAVYDPLLPRDYFTSWFVSTGDSGGYPDYFYFVPVVKTASEARLFGIRYVIEAKGSPGPSGSRFDVRIGNEDLYRIPDSGEASLSPIVRGGLTPPINASSIVVPVTQPSPTSWNLATRSAHAEELRLRLTNLPGWHASIDGKPLQLVAFDHVMMQATIPAGHHVVTISYWPTALTIGIAMAIVALVGLVAAIVLWGSRRRL
jgi:hypothetical protein